MGPDEMNKSTDLEKCAEGGNKKTWRKKEWEKEHKSKSLIGL